MQVLSNFKKTMLPLLEISLLEFSLLEFSLSEFPLLEFNLFYCSRVVVNFIQQSWFNSHGAESSCSSRIQLFNIFCIENL